MDAISLLLDLFFGFILLMVILVGIALIRAIFGVKMPSGNQAEQKIVESSSNSKEERQIEKDTQEDSEGDGLMLFDNPMFPPEFDDEDDDT